MTVNGKIGPWNGPLVSPSTINAGGFLIFLSAFKIYSEVSSSRHEPLVCYYLL